MTRLVLGSPARHDNFFGRQRERALAWEYLQNDNLLLLAPRRVGKTSLLLDLETVASEKGFRAVYLTAESKRDEAALFGDLCDSLVPHLTGGSAIKAKWAQMNSASRRISKVHSVEFAPETNEPWQRPLRRLQEILANDDASWLILLDELPLFVMTMIQRGERQQAETLLHLLRGLRVAFPHVRWIFSGSIGLDTVTEEHGLTACINDLHRFDLGPFPEETARQFLAALCREYRLTLDDAEVTQLLERCGWLIPYHVQLLFGALRDQANPASPTRVGEAFESLLAPARKSYFIHWKDRLLKALGPVAGKRAVHILGRASHDPRGVTPGVLSTALSREMTDPESRRDEIRRLTTLLERDGYLVTEEGRLRFRSPLLRAFWQRHVAGSAAHA